MAPSDRPPASQHPSEHPETDACAVLEPPTRPPPALSAEDGTPGSPPILVVVYTKEARLLGHRFVLDRSPVLVGRSVENDIVLQDTSVSPRHAHLEGGDAVWWCVDDGSVDGLYIDDRRATGRAHIADGTRIGIGSTIFKFLSGGEREARYHEEVYQVTVRDGLTQVYRERYLVEALEREIVRARRYGSPLAVFIIEVDDLDAIAPSSGLPNAADHVRREIASVLRRCVPQRGLLARYGDERFVMVLPECTLETARPVAETLCESVASSLLPVGPRGPRATVCIGGAQRRGDDRAGADILARASRALQVAQGRGRGQLEWDAVDEGRS